MKLFIAFLLTFLAVACSKPERAVAADSRYWHSYGLEVMKDQRVGEAIAMFERAAAADPAYAMPHRSLGVAHAKLGNHKAAVEQYKLYLALEPDARDRAQVEQFMMDFARGAL